MSQPCTLLYSVYVLTFDRSMAYSSLQGTINHLYAECVKLIKQNQIYLLVNFVRFMFGLRACINDVRKIKIGKNQNQNWVLIGRGSKPPDYASLFFGNRCQTKEVPRDLMFIFRKINIGGVHLIEGFPNATRQRPEHSRVTTAARRQTAPPHNTHNFCWHGPRQRSHGEGNR